MKIPDCVVRGDFLLAAKDWMGPGRWESYLQRRKVPASWAERYMRAAIAWRQLPAEQPDGSPWSLGALLDMAPTRLFLVPERGSEAAD